MKKVILGMVFVFATGTMMNANTDSNIIEQVKIENTISPDGCFSMGAQIFFELVDNGYNPNEANDIATALETLCNILT